MRNLLRLNCRRSLPLLALAGLAPLVAAGSAWSPTGISLDQPYRDYVGPDSCVECHAAHATTQRLTAHFLASTTANERTVLGPFQSGRNRLATLDPAKELVMEVRDGVLQQSLVVRAADRDVTLRTGAFALVLGSVKGQTYLYWRHDVLCQLPASYTTAADAWAYSPGFPEGAAYFDRVIKPECMECHATVFEEILPDRVVKTDKAILGVTCEACHGPAGAHVRHHRAHREDNQAAHLPRIANLSRTQQVEACGYCHSGVKPDSRRRPAFSFRPGDRLADFFQLQPQDAGATPEVHGNQMGLLQQSRCYQESELTCTTCHDPHRDGRGELEQLAARCTGCHQDLDRHPPGGPQTEPLAGCIDCHMPLVNSKLIDLKQGGQRYNFAVRNHRIGIYRR